MKFGGTGGASLDAVGRLQHRSPRHRRGGVESTEQQCGTRGHPVRKHRTLRTGGLDDRAEVLDLRPHGKRLAVAAVPAPAAVIGHRPETVC